ncbi:RBBP8 N-terminal-like protein isoform X4 [Balaenoptera musculus]|uniref:RBBP8 N-terminal-like protein isoform X4 n=1 Tax=Balaenoptera musculus TaxID=9771 RepID=A0A8B8VB63_BALMU|nr:RBBP8 N-terminal-like protein isoform X4 [Balaenoptera musculus]
MESFMESLNRLKDVHENEITGLQNKLLELNSERCRLRAGLCDRCMVTQELARKKQQEFESSLLQSLQHVFLLTTELTRLQEENDALKEEVKQLRGPGPKPQPREGAPDPPSPLLLPSLGTWKAVTEKPLGGREETEDDHTERPVGYGTSPVAKISPGASLPEPRAPDMSPQHISNQLHGTIAVVRPGSRACSANRGSVNGTSPLPPPRSSPPSPPGEHSLPLDSFLQASLPSAKPCESPKRSLQADRLCHLNRHLALPRGSPHRGPQAPATAPSGLQPQGLKAREAEAWEEPAGLLGLPGALAGVRDPRLEGALHLLLARQLWARGRAGSAGLRGPPVLGKTPPSPPAGSHSEGPRGGAAGAALPRGQHPQPTGPGSPGAKEATATQDYVPDKPLDLSEWGRGRDGAPKPASLPGSLSPPGAHTPSPRPPQGAEPSAQSGVQGLSDGTKGAKEPEAEEPPPSTEPSHSLPGPSLPSPSGPGDEDRGRPKLPPCAQRPDGDSHPGGPEHRGRGRAELASRGTQGFLRQGAWAGPTEEEAGLRPVEQSLEEAVLRNKEPRGARSPRDPEDGSPSPSTSSWEESQGHPSLPSRAPHPTARGQDSPRRQPADGPSSSVVNWVLAHIQRGWEGQEGWSSEPLHLRNGLARHPQPSICSLAGSRGLGGQGGSSSSPAPPPTPAVHRQPFLDSAPSSHQLH